MIVELNENNFEAEAMHGFKVIEFYTTWCMYCKRQRIEFIDLEESDVWIGIVDGDESPEIAAKYGVKAYPTFVVLKNGEVAGKFEGFHEKTQLLNKLMTFA